MTFVIFSLVACPVFNDMSKHSLVLWPLLFVVVGFCFCFVVFFWGGGGRGCYVLFEKDFFPLF